MGRVWKVAVIGAGDMGTHHVKGWKMAGHEVLSVTDMDTNRANALAQEFQIPQVFADYEEAIPQSEVEIVSICLPLALHCPVTVCAAEKGKHVFCEKPLARNFDEVVAMESAVKKAGVEFGLGLQRNLSRGVHVAKDIIQQGKIGRPVVFQCDGVAEIRPKRTMHDAEGNAGPLMDLGCHYYMMWQTVFGSMPKTVYARGNVFAKNRQELSHIPKLAIDTASVVIEYESGDIGMFTVSWGMPPSFKMQSYVDRVYGPNGGLEGGFNNNTPKLKFYEEDQVSEINLETYPSLHAEQFSLFVNALNQGEPAPVSFQAGKDVLALTLAIFESIETGQVITFPDFYQHIVG